MGGNALKNTETRRLQRSEYFETANAVTQTLQLAFPAARIAVIPAYASKPDFGDLDVLVTTEGVEAAGGGERMREVAVELFHARELFKNGNVLSFDYRHSPSQVDPGFQVDVITMAEHSFDYALGYFSYNDLGNLIGRTAHKGGTAHGHDGLWYYFREGDYQFRNILLTRDYGTALAYLGYSHERFLRGFESLEDIFQYVAGSSYFNRDIFLLENRNAPSRVRDRKRKTYSEFLTWCQERPGLPAFVYPENKKEWFPKIIEHFPHFEVEFAQAERDLERARESKAKFNGEWVSSFTGLTGKELGALMKNFKDDHGGSALGMQQHVLDTDQDVLKEELQALKLRLSL